MDLKVSLNMRLYPYKVLLMLTKYFANIKSVGRMINITTMKTSKHEILKSKWMEIIKRHSESGQSIRQWCEENDISKGKFYYWQRVIREESLIKAGTLAVTGQAQFVEVKPSMAELKSKDQGTCAILHSNGNEIEILNGADPNTLEVVLNLMGRL